MNKIYGSNGVPTDTTGEAIYGLIARNTVKAQEVLVGASVVLVPLVSLNNRVNMLVFNNATNVIYIGGDIGLTVGNGYPLYPRDSLRIDVEDKCSVYAITTVAGQSLRILEGA